MRSKAEGIATLSAHSPSQNKHLWYFLAFGTLLQKSSVNAFHAKDFVLVMQLLQKASW